MIQIRLYVDDSGCTYTSCGPVTGVYVSDIIHDRATFNWDDMNSSNCQVDQIRFRYRAVGTNSWSLKTMGVPVGSGCNTTNTSKLVLNLNQQRSMSMTLRFGIVMHQRLIGILEVHLPQNHCVIM